MGTPRNIWKAFERDWILHRSSKDETREVAQWTPELVVIPPVPECYIGIDTLSNWQIPTFVF